MTSRLSNSLRCSSSLMLLRCTALCTKEILLIYRKIKYNVGYGGVDILVVDA